MRNGLMRTIARFAESRAVQWASGGLQPKVLRLGNSVLAAIDTTVRSLCFDTDIVQPVANDIRIRDGNIALIGAKSLLLGWRR